MEGVAGGGGDTGSAEIMRPEIVVDELVSMMYRYPE